MKNSKERLFLHCTDGICYLIEYIRSISLYFIYLVLINEENIIIKKMVINNWNEINKIFDNNILGKKVLSAVKTDEKVDIKNNYEVYRRKVKKYMTDLEF